MTLRFASANAPTACANAAARTAPNGVSSGKSGDATGTVPSYSSIRFTGYALGGAGIFAHQTAGFPPSRLRAPTPIPTLVVVLG